MNDKNKNLSLEDITCPYNFVPLDEKVIFPEWANIVYQDIPFKDSLSGKIEYTITAKSPILIGSGKDKNDKQNDVIDLSFCKDSEGNYFIPGTSLKGAFRSILEILSFSKMSIYDDYHYSYRDLHNDKYIQNFRPNKIHCGWLSISGNQWIIQDCGIPGRISHEEIDEHFKTNFAAEFKYSDGKETIPENKKSAQYKYEKALGDKAFGKLKAKFIEADGNNFRKMYKISDNGKSGTIVFTGQPSVRKEIRKEKNGKWLRKKTGKWLEFVFFEPTGKEYNIEEAQKTNFKKAYFNNEPNESEDWKYWKSKLNKDENTKIPVFFTKDDNGNKIKHFGLSQLYKLPYKCKISDLLQKEHKEKNRLDFAQCLFGYTSKMNKNGKEEESALKGRVQFSHAFISKDSLLSTLNNVKPINKILSSPKGSFYPFYISQEASRDLKKDLKNYDDNSSKLAGFKRYPVHLKANLDNDGNKNKKLLTSMRPLPEGTKFEGVITFHNLRPEEFGSLLSALTFNGEKDCFHTLGAGKPFGFGKSILKINSINIVDYNELKFAKLTHDSEYSIYIEKFNNYVKSKLGKPNETSPQYKELISMSKEYADLGLDKLLKYMKLEDFARVKKNKLYLEHYDKIIQNFKKTSKMRS